jgi:hypothetical protein
MKRTAATILTTLAIAAATLTPATAAPGPVSIPLCVSTVWRHEHTGQPFTKPGQACQARAGMWIPRSWVLIGWVGSQRFEVYRRPGVSHDPVGIMLSTPDPGVR